MLTFLLLALALRATAQSGSEPVIVLVRQGQAALDAGDYARAAANFEKARQLAPENLDVYRGLLLSYLQEKRLDDAENFGRSAVARFPRDGELLHWLGLVYFKKGQ